ncbi:hypothetical protein CK203_099624 [Vitis vinifera]|uniref:RRP12 N-terminal HEAT domain-containing protein n=1 Tax=Vitis vinifera TaxID=29760 RepID=A0A438E9C7_VITVI|nr:hypothetical protein CK203_099624 [Vitis vinifera]
MLLHHLYVRRQSHVCIHDTLQSFQGSSALAPASEGITNIFERYLLLAGGSNAAASERPKGAQEVIYILDALKDCLPLMSMKFTTTVLKYLKTLLELHQPLVTRRIMDSLNAIVFTQLQRTVDDITFTTRLLDVGMRKVHSLDRKICIVKLPVIFNALRDVLASEHEEALHAATEALKSLIHACIDVSLIKQGVNQITMNADMETRSNHCYPSGENSSYLLMGTLKALADIQKLPDEDLIYRKQWCVIFAI